MSRWLYNPETDSWNEKEFVYNSPIYENDALFNRFSYLQPPLFLVNKNITKELSHFSLKLYPVSGRRENKNSSQRK